MRILSVLLLLCLVACKKEEASKSKTELLTTGSWHITAYTVDPAIDWDGDGTDESDVYPVIEACVKDDHTTFFTDGTAELDEGATKCNSADPQVNTLQWVMDENEGGVTIQGVHYIIEALTESELVVEDIEVVAADTYTHRVTFSH